jgi:hypothetical protein
MKFTQSLLLATLAAFTAALPTTITRTPAALPDSKNMIHRAEHAINAYRKRNGDLAESANYIFVLEKDTAAYSDEVKAVDDPATVLGKRGEDLAESVNYIFVLEKDTKAYADEVGAVADPATVLGKRGEDLAESVNYIFVLEKDTKAYADEINAVADPATVLGRAGSA